MCSNKECLYTSEKVDGVEVVIMDNSVCKVEGTCTIKLKMHCGIVRTLRMVIYISSLRKNLVSLGTFDKNSYTYKAMRGKILVSRGI